MPDGTNYGSDSTATLLAERGKTHGDFTDHARITSRLKDVVGDEIVSRINRGQQPLSQPQREALDMILHKIGRIIAGNANFQDHWDDIAGYAKLVSDRCVPPPKPSMMEVAIDGLTASATELNYDKKTPCSCRDMDRCLVEQGMSVKYCFCRKAERADERGGRPGRRADDHQNERVIPRYPHQPSTHPVSVAWGREDPGDVGNP